eukprot:TRINITY_DN15035_c0_g1_i2.p1 TRINITY_DN15035_c0_g1~~TRINITY_DN15035_c0_g1_i2.p1  ORF type:complete len:445 (+),score=90.71 TRINITY_DN15035_c0_g1_i2:71-1336(+)
MDVSGQTWSRPCDTSSAGQSVSGSKSTNGLPMINIFPPSSPKKCNVHVHTARKYEVATSQCLPGSPTSTAETAPESRAPSTPGDSLPATPDSSRCPSFSDGVSVMSTGAFCQHGKACAEQAQTIASGGEDLHDVLQQSIDSMVGTCVRLRGDDMVAGIQIPAETPVIGFQPAKSSMEEDSSKQPDDLPMPSSERGDVQQRLQESLDRGKAIALEILEMSTPGTTVSQGTIAQQLKERLQQQEELLRNKDAELTSLRAELCREQVKNQEACEGKRSVEAELREMQTALCVRDRQLRVRSEDLTNAHLELHRLKRQLCSLEARCQHLQESQCQQQTKAAHEMEALRTNSKRLEEVNLQLRLDLQESIEHSVSQSGVPFYYQSGPRKLSEPSVPELDLSLWGVVDLSLCSSISSSSSHARKDLA